MNKSRRKFPLNKRLVYLFCNIRTSTTMNRLFLMHLMNADTITIALNNFIAWKWCCFPLFIPYHWAYQISVNRMKKCVLFSGQTQWHHESTLVSKLTRKKENSLHRFRKTLAPNDRGRSYIEKFKIHLNFSWNWILLWNIIGCFSILRLHCLLCSWWFWLQANFFEFFFLSFHIYSGHPRRKSYLTSDGSISNANDKRRRFCYGENVWAQKNTSKFELFIMRIIKNC